MGESQQRSRARPGIDVALIEAPAIVSDASGRVRGANGAARALLGALLREGEVLPQALAEDEASLAILERDGRHVPVATFRAALTAHPGEEILLLRDASEGARRREAAAERERLDAVGSLAAGLAHEINNPMGFVHANLSQLAEYARDLKRLWSDVQALLKVLDAGTAAEAEEARSALGRRITEIDADYVLEDLGKAVGESLEGAERVRHIVRSLGAWRRSEADGPVAFDLDACVEATARVVWAPLRRSARLICDFADSPRVLGVPADVQRIVMQLLSNALAAVEDAHAREPGHIGEIALRTRVRDDRAELLVEDNGPGVPPAIRERVFEPFFSTRPVGAGTGLGLSTALQLARGQGGDLRCGEPRGIGARFSLTLPLVGAESSQ